MSSKAKKIAAAATAVALSASLLLGGTYAWQSVNQVALNEASDVVNPGGRLHDDFDGSNKDVYVENFASEDIFARVRLEEYMEVVMNYNTAAERVETIAGSKTLKEGATADADGSTEKDQFDYLYDIHYFDAENATDKFWNWETGGSTTYMPTFNKNKDSLQADVNGVYVDAVGGISNRDGTQYGEYVDYSLPENAEKPAKAVYDADANNIEDEGVTEVEETHEAKSTLGATLMSMQEWIDAGSNPGEYWVYDTDGWVYWADAIEPDTATGLLLDGISLDGVMDDTWYYAINVVAQFVTADDLGAEDGTGFYDAEAGTPPSEDAVKLLEAIGVDVSGVSDNNELLELILDYDFTDTVYPTIGQGIKLSFDLDSIPEDEEEEADTSIIKIHYESGDGENIYLDESQYSYENGVLTITDEALDGQMLYVRDGSDWVLGGTIDLSGEDDSDDEWYGDSNILVDNESPNENGYIYLSGLNIEQDNSFEVVVNEDAVTLAENGLTATFHEDNITNTTFVVDADDPYKATLTIAAFDFNSVTITARYDDGSEETVTVVPLYGRIIVTPDMDGQTLSLNSGSHALEARDFAGEVTWTLNGANRSAIYDNEGAKILAVSSYESGTNLTLTASDGTNTATININVVQNSPYDGPTYSYYIKGSGEALNLPLMQGQEYYWSQSTEKSYELYIGMTNDFAANGGQIAITLEGLQTNDDGSYAAGFIADDGTLTNTASGQNPPAIRVSSAQTGPFTIKIDITGIDANKYEEAEYHHEIYIYPVPEDVSPVRSIRISSDDSAYDEGADADILNIGPGESAVVELIVSYPYGGTNPITADKVTWSLSPNTNNYSISPDESGDIAATVTHNCGADSCTCSSDTKVVAQLTGMSYTFTSDFTILPVAGTSDDEGGYEDEVTRDGNLTLNLSDDITSLGAGETVTISIEGYDDMSLFNWEILDGVGTYAVEGQSGVFTHYEVGTDEYQECACTTTIKATLKTDENIWGSVSFPCA